MPLAARAYIEFGARELPNYQFTNLPNYLITRWLDNML